MLPERMIEPRRRAGHLRRASAVLGLLVGLPQASSAGELVSGKGPTAAARRVVEGFDALFGGPHTGVRAVHAKGVVLEGVFTPTAEAAGLSRAEHFGGRPSPVVVRFSAFSGLPSIADGARAASPRGMSIKFLLSDGESSTDIVAHSYDGFPASTPEEFASFLGAAASPDPAVLQAFLSDHAAARRFADTAKPTPASYANEAFFGVNAFEFTNAEGRGRFGKYRIEPADGRRYLAPAEADARAPDFLKDELAARLREAPVRFRLLVQLAQEGDCLTDGALPWPGERATIEVGTLSLDRMPNDQAERDRSLFFTPLNLVAGRAPSADPMLVARNRAYRLSFARRQGEGAAPRQVSEVQP